MKFLQIAKTRDFVIFGIFVQVLFTLLLFQGIQLIEPLLFVISQYSLK